MNSKSTQLTFSKMQGAGNDFMVIDAIHQTVHLSPQQIQQLANRQFGVGFDQLLLVESSSVADFKYRIFNADGNEVAQCGNGARCFVRFVAEQGLSNKKTISVETASGSKVSERAVWLRALFLEIERIANHQPERRHEEPPHRGRHTGRSSTLPKAERNGRSALCHWQMRAPQSAHVTSAFEQCPKRAREQVMGASLPPPTRAPSDGTPRSSR